MTTADLLELLGAFGMDENTSKEVVGRALHEFSAPKLAHLDSSWGSAGQAE
jgi:hypothetical protein